jgi:hypothetical protein
MNHKCPRLFINAVSNAQDNHKSCIANELNNENGPTYIILRSASLNEILYENLNLVWKYRCKVLTALTRIG